MSSDFQSDIERIARIEDVPSVLDVLCRVTGMRFAAVARVTESRWVACAVLDKIEFGLQPGGELEVESTICHEIRQSREAVVIDHVAADAAWCHHATPARYGFQSYISVPIILADRTFFGTLCAIDPEPNRLDTPGTLGLFRFFAELIAKRLDADTKLRVSESALATEREIAALRDQFIAVLGHDLRTPMRGILSFSELMLRSPLDPQTQEMAVLIRNSARRMNALINNLLDLARGRAGGLPIIRDANEPLEPALREVLVELKASHPDRVITSQFALVEPIACDRGRIAQLVVNLLNNAISYGSLEKPIRFDAQNSSQELTISVSNSGEQIPDSTVAQLFQPFYRGSPHNREGLGLGLHICHLIATAHGGTLDVSSTPEETRFTLRIPIGNVGTVTPDLVG